MLIQYLRRKCIGCNYCVEAAPERWQMSKRDGKSVLLGGKKRGTMHQVRVGEHEREVNEQAAKACPVDVIRID
jgi:ferredoxin